MLKKIIAILLVSVLTACTNTENKEIKELKKVIENVDYSSLKTNEEINNLYNEIGEVKGTSELFIEEKNKIVTNLKKQSIEIWEDELIKAIEKKQWNSYFDFRESLVFMDYYYWFSNESYYYNKENLDDYIAENKFLSRADLLSHTQNEDGYFLVADKEFEEVYTLTQYLKLFSFSKTEYPYNPPYSNFAIDTWKYDLSKINPNYSGKMADVIYEFGLKIFGSEDEWKDCYKNPNKYWTGNTEHYYFLTVDEINKEQVSKFGEEKVESIIQEEKNKAEQNYKYYVARKENSNNVGSFQTPIQGFVLENSKKVTDKDILVKCWTVATENVKNNLKSPSSAKFPFSAISDGVEILQDRNYYCVHGWVEADNSFGAKIKNDFIVLIEERNGQFIAYDCVIE